MKKRILSLVFVLLLVPVIALGAVGTVTVTTNSLVPKYIEQVIFTCVGGTDAETGTIPNTTISQQVLAKIAGMYLYTVTSDPGAVQPDAGDVFILNQRSEDLLGSDDNTTAVNGLNLIHATLTKTTIPALGHSNINFYPCVDGLITLQVSNQITASATWVITCTFVK